ncbi:predicted protein [Sclerotinia sclerotiorum 1980 UF-70]|uniref:Uncharacterized protein n=1 Tax=Sclerotinia sclerotiorum (strain ATCC 18683 / 1980 / Ss-1) TaxID=665079 RepID=A7E4I3_SCLS1|nr:predicted protein [Sclerotinia sclerotiorum 1980 UF-70]EDN90805.1 predicted protein [Sclerotinia sclerotiorum 1980 UF-70]
MSQQPLCGSLNWAIVLTFVDSVEWIFRCPQMNNGISIHTALELLESEVATMKYIK